MNELFVQLISKIFNTCGHDPPMSQSDGYTDDVISRPPFAIFASCDKNRKK